MFVITNHDVLVIQLDLRDLEIFYTVAQAGSMTGAARKLGYVQSHITGRVRALEAELRHTLFERMKTGVVLTAEGHKLYPYVESLLAQWDETRAVFAESDEPEGVLRIGSLETVAALHAAGWIAKYHAACPKVDISLQTATTKELLQDVLNRKLDVAFVSGPVESPDLSSRALLTEEMCVITPVDRTPDDMMQKNPVIVVFREGCAYRRALERWLAGRGHVLLRRMESGSVDTILQLVAGGLGLSMMPKAIVDRSPWRAQLRMHPFDDPMGFVTTYAVWRHASHLPRTLRTLLDSLSIETDTRI